MHLFSRNGSICFEGMPDLCFEQLRELVARYIRRKNLQFVSNDHVIDARTILDIAQDTLTRAWEKGREATVEDKPETRTLALLGYRARLESISELRKRGHVVALFRRCRHLIDEMVDAEVA